MAKTLFSPIGAVNSKQQSILRKYKKYKRSKACTKVLRLMDSEEDASYCDALKKVLSEDKRLSREKLEKELAKYI